ncbi:unnamed protein product [Porites lobata]|uniref:Uncharacterized protein n=1 Tax=Porites lobata TaxID=104759 RepID=A0ABN8PM54_9CNID|nr:unnamed protein product [Porites lobata]
MSDSDHPSDGATGTGPPIQRSSQFDAVFEQFKGYVDSRLHELSTASSSNTESSKSLSETKKLRREAKASKLKKKWNLKQFLFNAELLDEVKSITEDLQTQDTDSANKTAKRTIKLIERQPGLPVIKLADKGEAGWLAVDEYESDELAEDSADKKRIRKAQDKAVGKKFQMAKSASRCRSTGSSIRNVPSNSQDNLLFRGL